MLSAITKLTAAVGHIADEIERQREKVRGAEAWLAKFREVHEKLGIVERQQRATRVERLELGPEVSTAREAWLAVYNGGGRRSGWDRDFQRSGGGTAAPAGRRRLGHRDRELMNHSQPHPAGQLGRDDG
ncbi:MAG TPA: hypothetical protein VL242_52245 [Sorangium sp.]|nr:hypothetical protein [Sorangium sp.]